MRSLNFTECGLRRDAARLVTVVSESAAIRENPRLVTRLESADIRENPRLVTRLESADFRVNPRLVTRFESAGIRENPRLVELSAVYPRLGSAS
jgi:hypothetical protein